MSERERAVPQDERLESILRRIETMPDDGRQYTTVPSADLRLLVNTLRWIIAQRAAPAAVDCDADLPWMSCALGGKEAECEADCAAKRRVFKAGKELDQLRRVVAELLGADPETWPDHGNAPLAIAAHVAPMHQRAAPAKAREPDALREAYDAAMAYIEALANNVPTCDWIAVTERLRKANIALALQPAIGLPQQGTTEAAPAVATEAEQEAGYIPRDLPPSQKLVGHMQAEIVRLRGDVSERERAAFVDGWIAVGRRVGNGQPYYADLAVAEAARRYPAGAPARATREVVRKEVPTDL